MNKILLIAASCILLFASCKKEAKKPSKEEPEVSRQKYAVKVDLAGFEQSITPIASSKLTQSQKTTNAVEPPYSRIMWVVFDGDGKQVSRLEQNVNEPTKLYRVGTGKKWVIKTNATLGALTDSLYAGTYTLAVMAGPQDVSLNAAAVWNQTTLLTSDTYSTVSTLANSRFYFGRGDAFLYKGELKVAATNAAKSITLNRVASKVTIKIEDEIPANIKQMQYRFENLCSYLSLNDLKSGGPRTMTIGIQTFPSRTNFTMIEYVYNQSTPLTLTIGALDNYQAIGTPLYSKTLSNIVVPANRQTTLTGKLFSNYPSGFNITVNENWETGSTINF